MNLIVSPPTIVKKIFNHVVWEVKTEQKEIFLTFDDGPTSNITNWIIDILEYFNAKATFFLIGKNVLNNPEMFEKIKKHEHSFGNHTFNHLNGWANNDTNYLEDIQKTDNIIKTDLFRPPYGKIRPSQTFQILKNKKIILWNLLTKDYDCKLTYQNCFELIKKFTQKGSIIVFHDSLKAENNMKHALEKTLIYYSNLGYKFSKII